MTKMNVIATPIGNLGDLSARATELLRAADIVYAEDTRQTKKLLDHVGARPELKSCHQHNELDRAQDVIGDLDADRAVCLVTDAGAPAISDPGGRLIEALIASGREVAVVPGPSALTAALMGAGVRTSPFSFLGFVPKKSGPKRRLFEALPREHGVVLFESTERADKTLEDLFAVYGARPVVGCRELTKRHETFHRGVLGQPLSPPIVNKGELVIVVAAADLEPEIMSEDEVDARVLELNADKSLKPKARAKQLAAESGLSTQEAYARLSASSEMSTFKARQDRARTSSAPARERLVAALEEAAEALLEADGAGDLVAEGISSGSIGADRLMKLLSTREQNPRGLLAPVEVIETAKAILSAISAADALEDALELLDFDAKT